jgi:iron complex outermembrane receptor protein
MQVTPETENLNVFGRFSRKLGSDWQLSLTASMFQSKDAVVPNYIGPFSTMVTPFTPAPIGPALGAAPGPKGPIVNQFQLPGPYLAPVPASIAGQFAGGVAPGTLEPIQITLTGLGPAQSHSTTQNYRLVGDLTGSLGPWDLNATYGWTAAITEIVDTGNPNYAHLYNALSNGTLHIGQASGLNTAAIYNYVAPPIDSSFKDYLWFTNLHASRDLFNIWGGPVSFASGVDFFFRNLSAIPSDQTTTGVQPSTASDFFASGTQNDISVFGELAIPVIKRLEVDVSARYDHYNTFGSTTNPKAGFKYKPIDQVLLRGTYSEGFRAPNPIESGNSAAVGFFTVFNDPALCPTASPTTTPGNFPSQCALQSTNVTTGTPGIQPETSKSYTLGIVLEPIRQVSTSVDFFDIKLTNQIVSGLGVPGVTQTLVRGTPAQEQYVCTAADATAARYGCTTAGQQVLRTTPVGLFAYFTTPYVNLNSTRVRGIDFGWKTKLGLDEFGTLTADLNWSHLLEYLYTSSAGTVDLAGTHGPSVISGDTATPRNRARFALSWDRGPYGATGTLNYVGPYNVTDPSFGEPDCLSSLNNTFTVGGPAFPGGTTPPPKYCNVSSFTTFDLYLKWNPDKHWLVHGTVRNLFNRAPPIDLQSYGSFNFNPSLHMDGAIGRFFDLGLSYSW